MGFFFALERIYPQGKPKPPPRQNKVVRAARRIKRDRVQIVGSLAHAKKKTEMLPATCPQVFITSLHI